jgi:ATP/maltotriose-dependent transcriptional regulator MalT
MLTHHEGRPAEARRLALEALALIDQAPFSLPQVKASIYCGLATFDIAAGNLDGAAERLAEARTAVEVTQDMPIAANVTTGVADLLLARGDAAAAAEMLGAGISLRGAEDLGDPDVQRVAGVARAVLGLEQYARHHETGRNRSRESIWTLIGNGLKAPP